MEKIKKALSAITESDVENIIVKNKENLINVKKGKVYNFRHEAFHNRLPVENGVSLRRPDLMWIRSEGYFP